jgi:uncharacterized membrane protein
VTVGAGEGEDERENPWTATSYRREGTGLEFERVAVFADAVYAIALTLIVVTIEVPRIADSSSEGQLLEALNDQLPAILMFFIAFVVIGNYWLAHHRFVSSLGSVSSSFMRLHLLYLAFIAFLPFPAALLGRFDDNSLGPVLFALSMACASGMEAVLYVKARRDGLMWFPISEEFYRWGLLSSLSPVAVFLVSIPLAFVAPWLGVAAWALAIPVGVVLNRMRPARAVRARRRRREPPARPPG